MLTKTSAVEPRKGGGLHSINEDVVGSNLGSGVRMSSFNLKMRL